MNALKAILAFVLAIVCLAMLTTIAVVVFLSYRFPDMFEQILGRLFS